MRWSLVFFLLYNYTLLNKSKSLQNNFFSVQRWEYVNYGLDKGKKHIFEKREYDETMRLVNYVEMARGACNVVDSVIFQYNKIGKLASKIEFVPTDSLISDCRSYLKESNHLIYYYSPEGYLSRIDTINFSIINFNNSTVFLARDSLKLLQNEFRDILLVMSDSKLIKLKTINVNQTKIFSANFIPTILSQYGIPSDALLKSMTFDLQNGFLVNDNFDFKFFFVKREYVYKNCLPQEIKISVTNKRTKIITKYLEGFNYSLIQK